MRIDICMGMSVDMRAGICTGMCIDTLALSQTLSIVIIVTQSVMCGSQDLLDRYNAIVALSGGASVVWGAQLKMFPASILKVLYHVYAHVHGHVGTHV